MHKLPELGYDYNSLEPHIDEQTMKIHHDKHHKAYVDKLNAAIEKYPVLSKKPIDELIKELHAVPAEIKNSVRNNGGGHLNHSFFWTLLKKDVKIKGEILRAINERFGSFEEFKKLFIEAAMTRFGSGWAWLTVNEEGLLEIISTQNQDNPFTLGKTPILGVDVWEHAYYLKYQNRRNEYLEAFFNVINWEQVNEYFKNSKN